MTLKVESHCFDFHDPVDTRVDCAVEMKRVASGDDRPRRLGVGPVIPDTSAQILGSARWSPRAPIQCMSMWATGVAIARNALKRGSNPASMLDVLIPAYKNVYMAVTVRIDPAAHAALTEIARAKHLSLTEALSRAVEAYRRAEFFAGLASDFVALQADDAEWAQEKAEREAWDVTNTDGLAGE